ncbi:MAG: DUF2764 family protein [Bacteroidales bacterium]
MSKYYCLIAGLPDIHIDDQKLAYSVAEFKEEVYEQLSAADRKLFDLFFLKYDNANLLNFLKDKDAQIDPRGSLDTEALDHLVKLVKDGDAPNSMIPAYLPAFIASYFEEKALDEGILPEDVLAASYYGYALNASNNFAAQWFEFNLNLNNLLIASAARKYHFDAANFIVGDNEVAKALRSSSARDWGLTGTVDFLEAVQRIAEETDLTEKERKIDLLKWNWLEENSFFHYFTGERLLAYLLKLEIIERWFRLNKETGEAQLREMIARLKSEVKMPEDFE